MPHCALPEAGQDLKVGGFQPFTSLDFPGHLSAVIFCQGCPLRCVYCHNRDLLSPESDETYSWLRILKHLESRQGFLDAVVFSGGEPLMQAALEPAICKVKGLGFKIALHTAGIAPSRLERILPLIDWVGLDVKAGFANYGTLTGVEKAGVKAWKSLDILLKSDTPFEVRTTVWPDALGVGSIRQLALRLAEKGVSSFALQEARDPHSSLPLGGAAVLDKDLHKTLAATFDSFDLRRAA